MSSSPAKSQIPEPSIEKIQRTIDGVREGLGERKFLIAIFATATHVPHLFYLGREIARCGHKVVYIVPPRCPISEADQDLAEAAHILNLRVFDIPKLRNIDVFVGTETYMKFGPEGARTVAVFHSLPESLPGQ